MDGLSLSCTYLHIFDDVNDLHIQKTRDGSHIPASMVLTYIFFNPGLYC